MKVLQVIDSLNTGGAEKLLLETIPLIIQKQIEVDLLVLDCAEYPYMKQLKELNCCKIYSTGVKSLFNPLQIFKIIPYLKKYDLIHVHLFPAQYWVVFAKIISFSSTKIVLTEHSTSNRRIQNKWFKFLERFIYSFYFKIICITDQVKEIIQVHTKLEQEKLVVIGNGINLKKMREASILEKHKIHDSILNNDKIVIQIAGFRIEKDQKTVIRAFKYLDKKIKLLLVGEGPFRKECELLVQELDLREQIFFLGTRTDVPSLLKTCDLSVISSHWEGFGLAAVEGMASKKPLLASNVIGLANVVGDGGVLFEKGNVMELTSKIQELLSNKTYYNRIAETGFKRARQFDINMMVDKQIDLYNELLK